MDDNMERDTKGAAFEQERLRVARQSAGNVSARTVEINQGAADSVQATDVTVRMGGVRDVRGQIVSIRQGAAVIINSERVDVVQGAVGLVRSSEASLGPGTSSGAVLADNVKMEQAAAQLMLARENVEMQQSAAMIVAGQTVTARNSAALFLVANNVEGDVRVMMDRQAAMSLGAALGAVVGVFVVLRRVLGGRK